MAIDARLRGHVPALDGVRGLAILLVLLLHFFVNPDPANAFEKGITRVLNLGVDLFFVLSGFLITGILIEAKGKASYFSSFYMRRALRIFPLYYGVLFAVFVVAPHIAAFAGPDLQDLESKQAWAWLYGVNILTGISGHYQFPYMDHFWSLAVEEHFYFFWPLVVFACSTRTLLRVTIGVAAASLLARIVGAVLHVNPLALYVLTPFRLDALCLGAAFATYVRGPGGVDALERVARRLLLVSAVVFVASFAASRASPELFEPVHQLRASTLIVALGYILVAAVRARPGTAVARFFGAPLQFLGKYSYGLYVYHHFLSFYYYRHSTDVMITRWVGSHRLAITLQATVGIAVSIVVAMTSYHFFEKPFLAMKDRWKPRSRDDGAPAMLDRSSA